MVKAAYAPPISLLLLMMLVVLAGTAWFAALHPRFIRRMMLGEAADAADRECAVAEFQRIRWSGLAVGSAALLLLMMTDAM